MTKPMKYDMTKPEDMKRWFDEMEGYLKTEDFVNRGTDFEGRRYALDGFHQLKKKMLETDTREECVRNM